LRHQLHSFDIDLAASKKQCFDGIWATQNLFFIFPSKRPRNRISFFKISISIISKSLWNILFQHDITKKGFIPSNVWSTNATNAMKCFLLHICSKKL
jgi:hypothetical protein